MRHTLPKFPYDYAALEPFIDARTMEIHHTKHHQTYVDKLNDSLANYPELQEKTLIELLQSLDQIPEQIRTAVRNNGGGHFNHTLFWEIIGPNGEKIPANNLKNAIDKDFGSFETFKENFSKTASTFFGSGWVWLAKDKEGKLKIVSTQGHDNPIMTHETPLMVLDVWEHAYYLKYQNRRPEYVENWWNVVNWSRIENKFNASS